MSRELHFRVHSGADGISTDWRLFLPHESQIIRRFSELVTIWLRGEIVSGSPPPGPDRATKIFVEDAPKWQDSQAVIDAFALLWPDMLEVIAHATPNTVSLVYFSGPATHDELFSVWPYLPLEFRDDRRFFVSEICKCSRKIGTIRGRICIEYVHDEFKQLAGPEGFSYSYGTTVMGVSVSDARVDAYLKRNLLDKNVLEESLQDDGLRCWWFCDTDFEGMTIWHKDLEAGTLSRLLRDELTARANAAGLILGETGRVGP